MENLSRLSLIIIILLLPSIAITVIGTPTSTNSTIEPRNVLTKCQSPCTSQKGTRTPSCPWDIDFETLFDQPSDPIYVNPFLWKRTYTLTDGFATIQGSIFSDGGVTIYSESSRTTIDNYVVGFVSSSNTGHDITQWYYIKSKDSCTNGARFNGYDKIKMVKGLKIKKK